MALGNGDGNGEPTAPSAESVFASLLSAERNTESREPAPEEESVETTSEPVEDETPIEQGEESEGESAENEEAGEEVEPNEQEEQPQLYTVKIDGKEEQVPLDELVKGYSRTADYTRKTQALAEERKQLESVKAERAQYAEGLKQLQETLQALTPQEPDWDTLRNEDPAVFAATWADWQRHQSYVQSVAQERARVERQQAEDQKNELRELVTSERNKLVEKIPAWKDEKKAQADMAALAKYGESEGFTADELSQVFDHRAIVILRKAMLFDQMQKAKPVVQKKLETVKTVTPGPGVKKKPVSKVQEAHTRLAKTGKAEHAIPIFMAELAKD